MSRYKFIVLFSLIVSLALRSVANDKDHSPAASADTPIAPQNPLILFNGKDLSGLKTWLRDSQDKDPRGVFRVTDKAIHISGEGYGYLRTDKPYRDYRVVIEYKWGTRTDGGQYVRNSGLLLHATGPDGSAGKGAWMPSIEVQLAQGCEGDLIPIRGVDDQGQVVPVKFFADVQDGPDKRPRWKPGGAKREFTSRQLWWKDHQPFFKELLDTRGDNDVASPLGEWTRVECICDARTIIVKVNGVMVNKAYEVFPSAGRILLQCEGHELFVRTFELHPLAR